MELILDIAVAVGAVGAALYCLILSRRLKRLSDLDRGVGGAIAVLSLQVDDLQKALARTERSATETVAALVAERSMAEDAVRDLRLMLASLHDLPPARRSATDTDPFFTRKERA